MSQEADNEFTRYLLGEMPEAESMRLEERFFTDDEFYAQLLAAEHDLIDSYVRGRLPEPQRAQFERRFLATPQRRQKVKFAQSLQRATSAAQATATAGTVATGKLAIDKVENEEFSLSGAWRNLFGGKRPMLAFGAAALLVVLGGAMLLVVLRRDKNVQVVIERQPATERREPVPSDPPIAEQNSSGTRSKIENLDQSIPASEQPEPAPTRRETEAQTRNRTPRLGSRTGRQAQPAIASFVLTPGLLRGGGEQNKLVLSPQTSEVRLQLDTGGDVYPTYRAVLQTPDGDEVWSADNLKLRATPGGKAVMVRVPAGLLRKGDYTLTLNGETIDGRAELTGEYSFSVIRK